MVPGYFKKHPVIHKNDRLLTRKKAEEIVDKIRESDRENAIKILMDFANHGLDDDPSLTASSGSIPAYKKPNKNKKRKKKPGWLGFRKILSNLLKRAIKLGDNKDEITPEQSAGWRTKAGYCTKNHSTESIG